MPVFLTKRICELLVEKGLVSASDLARARDMCKDNGGDLGGELIKMKAVTREDIIALLSAEFGFPPIDLSLFKVEEEVLDIIPEKIALRYNVLPLSVAGDFLTVAVSDPLNVLALDDLKLITRHHIRPVLAPEEDISDNIKRYYRKDAAQEFTAIVGEIDQARIESVEEESSELSSEMLISITEDAPVVKLTNMILSSGVKERASDILIEPMEDRTRIRYRLDGILMEGQSPPKKFHRAIISRIKVLSQLNITETRLPQDGRFQAKIDGRKIDFRVSVVPSSLGEKAVLRILDKSQSMTDIEMLGFKERDIETIKSSARKPHGMILVCGPTGSGKTTTLYSILQYVDSPDKNLITVEDPVEYEISGVNQVNIYEKVGLTFEACLRSVLRQDPDIIMVGEIRDHKTLDISIKSALTGHLVLSTLHTNTASGAVVRMVNMGIEPFLIASSVEIIAAQRLIRKLCTECKQRYEPERDIIVRYGLKSPSGADPITLYKPRGCKRCRNTGYAGRIGIIECLRMTERIQGLVFSGAREAEIEKAAIEEGTKTLRQNAVENVMEGKTSIEEVLRATTEVSGEQN